MVFQGTVLGPQLWNLFFADVADAIREFMFEEVIFADDLNAYRILPSSTPNGTAMQALYNVQHELHKWGEANQVSFDAVKESNTYFLRPAHWDQTSNSLESSLIVASR
jgi:hypothetical protein